MSDTTYGNYSFPCVPAMYRPHPLERLSKNHFVSALKPWPTEKQLRKQLEYFPDYDTAQRQLDRPTRIQQLKQLKRFAIALPRVVQLAESTHATMLEGYLGREPHTPEFNCRLDELYRSDNLDDYQRLCGKTNTAQFTSALVGMSGVGKSFSMAAIAGLYPPVIHHKELNVYQIPILQIEMPYNGSSVGTLATAILTELHRKFPMGNYKQQYIDTRGNAEQKLLSAFSLMYIHALGLLHVDEAQNKNYERGNEPQGNASSGQTRLSTLLITASNQMRVPLLLTGTAELREVLGKRMSHLRRMVGDGMRPWTALSDMSTGNRRSEFDVFLTILWTFQWTQNVSELTTEIRTLFFDYTAGVPDFVVKLYHDVQFRAMHGGDEKITPALIKVVAESEFGAIRHITQALVKRDRKSLAKISTMSDLSAELGISPTDDLLVDNDIYLSRMNEWATQVSMPATSTVSASVLPSAQVLSELPSIETFASPLELASPQRLLIQLNDVGMPKAAKVLNRRPAEKATALKPLTGVTMGLLFER